MHFLLFERWKIKSQIETIINKSLAFYRSLLNFIAWNKLSVLPLLRLHSVAPRLWRQTPHRSWSSNFSFFKNMTEIQRISTMKKTILWKLTIKKRKSFIGQCLVLSIFPSIKLKTTNLESMFINCFEFIYIKSHVNI